MFYWYVRLIICFFAEHLFHGTGDSFLGAKAAEAWSLPLTSMYYQGYEDWCESYIPPRPSWPSQGHLPLYIHIFCKVTLLKISVSNIAQRLALQTQILHNVFSSVGGFQNRLHPLLSKLFPSQTYWHSKL
jgi:hypothetical protein